MFTTDLHSVQSWLNMFNLFPLTFNKTTATVFRYSKGIIVLDTMSQLLLADHIDDYSDALSQ